MVLFEMNIGAALKTLFNNFSQHFHSYCLAANAMGYNTVILNLFVAAHLTISEFSGIQRKR